jgi:hypothetical protein
MARAECGRERQRLARQEAQVAVGGRVEERWYIGRRRVHRAGQSRVMKVVAEGRCVYVSLLSWARVTGCRSLVNKERQRKRRRRRGVCVCTSWNCIGTDSSSQGSGRRRQGSRWSSPESPARPQTTQPQPQLRQVSTRTVANVHIDQPFVPES